MLKKLWKLFVAFLAVIGGINLTVFLLLWALLGNTIQTVSSIEQVEGTDLYLMEYHGDYGFDNFLKTGASTHEELLAFLVEEMTHGLPIELYLGEFGCTTFAADTPNGHALMGRNFDMPDTPAMLVRTNPRNGYKSISMVSLLFFRFNSENPVDTLAEKLTTFGAVYLPMDGMNEKGLAVSVMQVNGSPVDQQTDKTDITTSTAIRLLLDKAATVEEAVELLGQYDMHSTSGTSYHFMIADARGNSAVVEYVNNEMVVLWNKNVSTNFLLAPQDFSSGLGLGRYWTAKEALDETGGILSRQDAMDLLRSCRLDNTVEMTESSTQWSCVYDLKSRTVDIVMHEDWDNVLTYKLSRFPFF